MQWAQGVIIKGPCLRTEGRIRQNVYTNKNTVKKEKIESKPIKKINPKL